MLLALKLTLPFLLLISEPRDCSQINMTVSVYSSLSAPGECLPYQKALYYETQAEATEAASYYPCENVAALIDLRYPVQLNLKCKEVKIPGRKWVEEHEDPPKVEWRYWVEP